MNPVIDTPPTTEWCDAAVVRVGSDFPAVGAVLWAGFVGAA